MKNVNTIFEKYLEKYHCDNQDEKREKMSDDRDRIVYCFHKWMKELNELDRGTRLDYRRMIYENMDECGELQKDESNLGMHGSAAVSKFKDFMTEEALNI